MVIGAGAVQAWIKASAPDVDLQVTVSEVRPDGRETFVQDGWLRASERKLDPRGRAARARSQVPPRDVAPLPEGRYSEVTVPLYYEGHVIREGSRIRVTISAREAASRCGASRGQAEGPRERVGGVLAPAALTLVLPVVPGVAVPTVAAAVPGAAR